jgi:glycosyltransferase involved in cell wall biosynthesis
MKHSVLLLARELHQGGSERQLTEVALGLDRARFEPHVGAFRPDGMRGNELRNARVPTVHFPVYSFRSAAAVAGLWQLVRYIRHHKIQLVHSFDAPLTVYAMPGVRYFTSAVAVSSQRGHRDLAPELRPFLRWTDRHLVDGVVVNCNYLKSHLINDEQVAEGLVHICHNGIDLQQFLPGPSNRPPSLPEDALVIGVVCALRPEKGLLTLVDAFARVRPLREEMKLVFVGSGSVLPDLQARAQEAGVAADCVWEPVTADVAKRLRMFDVFVLPSLSEALSNSLMEAMACGRPVIASNVGGNPELVHDAETGLLFEPGNVGALAEALGRLINDPSLRKTLGYNGEKMIRQGFSRAASAGRMGEIYEELLAKRRR